MNRHTVSEIIDQLGVSKYTWKNYLLIGLALIFAGYSYMIISFTMPQMAGEWSLTKVQTGSLSSWSLIGLLIGGMAAGVISDRIGRKKTFIGAIVVFAVFTFPIYFVESFAAFAILRVLGGLGFGACIPISITWVAESAPAQKRGVFTASIMSWYVLGWIMAGVAAIYIIPNFGWRVCYLLSGISFLYVPVLLFALLESPHWLLGKGKEREAIEVVKQIEILAQGKANEYKPGSLVAPPPPPKVGVGAIFSADYRKATLTLWTVYFMGSVIIYGINGWLPTLMLEKGYGLAKGYTFAIMQNLFGAIGSVCTGYTADIIGRRKNVIFGWAFTAVAVLAFGFVTNQWLVVILASVMGFAINWGLSGTQIPLAEGYPTEFRSTGVSWAQSFGRVGGFFSPIVGGYVLQMGAGFTGIIILYAIPAVIAALVAFFFLAETKGKNFATNTVAKV